MSIHIGKLKKTKVFVLLIIRFQWTKRKKRDNTETPQNY